MVLSIMTLKEVLDIILRVFSVAGGIGGAILTAIKLRDACAQWKGKKLRYNTESTFRETAQLATKHKKLRNSNWPKDKPGIKEASRAYNKSLQKTRAALEEYRVYDIVAANDLEEIFRNTGIF